MAKGILAALRPVEVGEFGVGYGEARFFEEKAVGYLGRLARPGVVAERLDDQPGVAADQRQASVAGIGVRAGRVKVDLVDAVLRRDLAGPAKRVDQGRLAAGRRDQGGQRAADDVPDDGDALPIALEHDLVDLAGPDKLVVVLSAVEDRFDFLIGRWIATTVPGVGRL